MILVMAGVFLSASWLLFGLGEGNAMKMTMINKDDKCLVWHRWTLIKSTGATKYYQCKDCPARHLKQKGGYQPINHDWISGMSDAL